MAVASPFFQSLPLGEHGLEWIQPPAMLAHPFDGDTPAAVISRSLADTAAALGTDERAYRRLVGSVVRDWPRLVDVILGPPGCRHTRSSRPASVWPRCSRPSGWRSGTFEPGGRGRCSRAMRAHGMLRLDTLPSGAVGLVLAATAHTHGWPIPRGGAQRLADALAGYLRSLGGEIVTNARIDAIGDLPAGARHPLRPLAAAFPAHRRPGAVRTAIAVSSSDTATAWAPTRSTSRSTVRCRGGMAGGERGHRPPWRLARGIATAERVAWEGRVPERPFVLLSQPSLFDDTRAPAGRHTVWTYCHVPHASRADMLPRIERQIERFAPGFRERILARHVMTPDDLERRNPNLAGGDIGMGVTDLRQMFARPTWRWYRTPRRGLYLCSAATPPGVGVHGMCGYHAAQRALRDVLR